jgi:hypothetical protein
VVVTADGTVIRSGVAVAPQSPQVTRPQEVRGPVAAPTHLVAVPDLAPVAPVAPVALDPAISSDDFAFGSSHVSRADKKSRGRSRDKRPRRFWPALIVGVLVAGAAGAYTVVSSNNTELVSFQYAYQQGQTRTYDMTMEMDMKPTGGPDVGPIQGTMHATMNMNVLSTLEDGSSVIEIAMSNLTVEPNPGVAPGEVGKLRVTIAPDGRVTKVEGFGGPFGAAGLDLGSLMNLPGGAPADGASSQFLFPQFPSDGVRPGDTWNEQTTIPFPFTDGEITVKTEGRFDGFEETQYGRAAKMHHTSTIPLNLDFTMAEIFDAMTKLSEGAEVSEIPPEARTARFIISGQMQTVTESLVLPAAGDAVRMDGTTSMSLQMRFEGIPAEELQGMPNEIGLNGTTKMTIIRVDGVSTV